MNFQIVSKISNSETFSSGSGVRELQRLKRRYGAGKWRKRKGVAALSKLKELLRVDKKLKDKVDSAI